MTFSRTIGSLQQQRISRDAAAHFNDLGIYRFSLAVAYLDIFDIYDFMEFNNFIKYSYAAIIIGFMAVYFLRWKKIYPTTAPLIFLLFFVVTGSVFALRFFLYDERNSYISAFISPLVFSVAIFIPPNSMALDARKITRDLTILLSVGTLFYVIEGFIKPLSPLSIGANEIQLLKSMNCLLALCLMILIGRKGLGLVFAILTVIGLTLRPASTLVLGLICCVPIAFALRPRVTGIRPVAVLVGRAIAMTTLILVVSIPLLLYFFFDDVASVIDNLEGSLKSDVIGGQSNMAFRLEILRIAFETIRNTSFVYGSALSGSVTVSLGQNQAWQWWYSQSESGQATIHSDFVLVLSLMGIIGYTVFSGAFYSVLKVQFRELARRNLHGGGVVLQSMSIVACVAILIYCSDQPYLSYYSHTHVVWLLLLISEVARKSKVVG